MADFDDELENEELEGEPHKVDKKKVVLFLVPLLVIIGVAVGVFNTFGSSSKKTSAKFSVVEKQTEEEGKIETSVLVFYDLPDIHTKLKDSEGEEDNLRISISVELSNVDDIKTVEAMVSKLTDIIITHTQELTEDEIKGVNGLYWLKEELLHRINLVTAPVNVTNINFKAFELQKKEE